MWVVSLRIFPHSSCLKFCIIALMAHEHLDRLELWLRADSVHRQVFRIAHDSSFRLQPFIVILKAFNRHGQTEVYEGAARSIEDALGNALRSAERGKPRSIER